jgi:hypothetical protein
MAFFGWVEFYLQHIQVNNYYLKNPMKQKKKFNLTHDLLTTNMFKSSIDVKMAHT